MLLDPETPQAGVIQVVHVCLTPNSLKYLTEEVPGGFLLWRLRRLRALPETCEYLLKSFASPATACAFCISKSMRMGTNLLSKLLTTGLVLALGSVSAAQTGSAVSEGGLRPSWSDSSMAEGWRAVCGDVRNVRDVPARGVAIRVQGLDSAGQVVSTRDRDLMAGVPAGSRAVFCVPMPAGATSYHVTVLGADWGFVQGP